MKIICDYFVFTGGKNDFNAIFLKMKMILEAKI